MMPTGMVLGGQGGMGGSPQAAMGMGHMPKQHHHISQAELGNQLTKAAQTGRVADIKALFKAGADIEAKDGSGGTALINASVYGNVEAVKFLVEAGPEVNAKEEYYGHTALYYAEDGARTSARYKPIVEYLRSKGASK
mmetsp:Transcript_66256/g.187208  ORF Transcript_66256/g.187208 Transcript_66256/m.187208 type:complete len:138 (+) Transcript_66256:3-416(+)